MQDGAFQWVFVRSKDDKLYGNKWVDGVFSGWYGCHRQLVVNDTRIF